MNEQPFTIKKATRQGVKPLVGLYSESGCGKTYSSLLLARGFVGPSGRIIMIDTESGRGELYADVIEGGYEVISLAPPFSPARYIGAVEAAEQSDAGIIVVDSQSHEWEGMGGVLDMAGDNEVKSGKQGLHNWKTPKMEHAKMVLRLLQSPLPMIICLRAKYKTRQTKGTKEMADNGAINSNQIGKTIILKDDVTTPIQADDFIFEMTAHCEILQNHSIILTKCSHPELRKCFPEDKTTPITVEHGRKLAEWCNKAAKTPQPMATASALPEMQMRLWKLLAPIRTPKRKGWDEAEGWLTAKNIITEVQTVEKLSEAQLQEVIDKAEIAIGELALS